MGCGKNISEEEYNDFKQSWDVLKKLKYGGQINIGQYMEHYNVLDSLLLAEIHTNFSSNCFKYYQLYTEKFLTLPSFSYEVKIKICTF